MCLRVLPSSSSLPPTEAMATVRGTVRFAVYSTGPSPARWGWTGMCASRASSGRSSSSISFEPIEQAEADA